jgi:hypothetical protein
MKKAGHSFTCALLLAWVVATGTSTLSSAPTPSPLPPAPSRPDNGSGPTKVAYAFWIGDLLNIDSVDQEFTANFMLFLQWHDPLLAHPGPGTKTFALDEIWHPRVLITNEAGNLERSLPEVADVTPDGKVTYRQRFIGSFIQRLNLHAFPFDQAAFAVQFVVPGYRPEDLEFLPIDQATAMGWPEGVGIEGELTIQDWRVLSVKARPQAYQAAPGISIAGFAFTFTAERRANHFIVKVIIPLVLIVMMSWAVFWVEPNDASTQVGVAVTAMLTLIAYRFAIDSDVPKLPYLTRLDAFILMSSLLVFLSLIEVLVTTKFANRKKMEQAMALDRSCRWLFPSVFVLGTAATLLGWF